MGKTSIVLQSFLEDDAVDCLLVFAPFRVATVAWPLELGKWWNFESLSHVVVHGPRKDRLLRQARDIYLFNHEFLTTKDVGLVATLVETRRCMLAVDESTAFKNPSSKRFKVMKELLPYFRRRVILTGTPTPNGIEGLWSQFYLVDEGGLFGPHITKFRYEYMVPNYIPGVPVPVWKAQANALDRITEKVSPVTLQLRAEDHLKLPEYIFHRVGVDIPREEYDTLRRQLAVQLDSALVMSPNIAANLVRLRQLCNGALYTDSGVVITSTAKLAALEDLVSALDGKPALLLYQFRHDLERIRERLGDIPSLSGATPAQSRALCQRFNAGELPVLAGHPASMGHGLNLQEGSAQHMIWFGLDYNLEYWQQSLQRLRRQGNDAESVHVHYIVANDSIEDAIMSTLRNKDSTQENFLRLLR